MGGLWPLTSGGRLRSFQILSELSRRHRVVLVTTGGPDDDAAGLAAHLPDCEEVVSVPFAVPKQGSARFVTALARSWLSPYPVDLWKWRVGAVTDVVRRQLASRAFDVVVADFLVAVPNVPATGTVPVVYFSHNVEHVIWRRLCDVERRPWRRAALAVEWRKMRRLERRACSNAQLTVAVSEEDGRALAHGNVRARVAAIPTGVDVDYFRPAPPLAARDHELVFSGSMDWFPNEDAMLHFVRAVLPRVQAEIPDVSLTIVGRRPSNAVRALEQHRGVRVTGTVDDVRPHIARGGLYVVPLRIGGGTRLKIFEALAMGKAVLSTPVGAEGLGLRPNVEFVSADLPDAFARAVVTLLRDPARRHSLGLAGRRLVEERYAWPQVARVFESHLATAARGHASPAVLAGAFSH